MNKTSDYEFTVIIPVYDEAGNVPRLVATLDEWLPTAPCPSCVLFIDDGSSDGSQAMISEACRTRESFFYAALERNSGLSAALKAGFDLVESPYVGYMDADMQTVAADFNLLLASRYEFALVTGIRQSRRDSWAKRVQSRLANAFRRAMTGDTARDTGCPLKVLRTDYARRLPMFTGMHRFFPALIGMLGGEVCQMPVRHRPRVAGQSKFHLSNRLVRPFVDCFAFRWMRSRLIDYRVADSNLR